MKNVTKNRYFILSQLSLSLLLTACGGESISDKNVSQSTASISMSAPPAAAPANAVISFAFPRNNYSIVKTDSGYAIKDLIGTGGTINVATLTTIKFTDMAINLAVFEQSKTISEENLKSLIELYIAFLNRAPDADGMSYWIDRMKAGMTIDQLSDSFYDAAVQYPTLTGYSPTMSSADFVRIIYKNVLGRSEDRSPPAAEDVNYWAGELNNGKFTKAQLVAVMLRSARTFVDNPEWGWVPKLLNDKVELGKYFSLIHGVTYYTPEESITRTMEFVNKLIAFNLDAAKGLINIKDLGFNQTIPVTDPGTGSGQGDSRNCHNTELLKTGAVYSSALLNTSTKLGTSYTTAYDYKVQGSVNFKGNTAQELWVATEVVSGVGAGTKALVKSYLSFNNDEGINYGNAVEMELPVIGKFNLLSIMTPSKRTPFSQEIDKPFTQTYTVKQEAVGSPFPMTFPEMTTTESVTFMGIESVTVPVGTFSACKFKFTSLSSGVTAINYTWQISDATYRGLTAKIVADDGDFVSVATKLKIGQ